MILAGGPSLRGYDPIALSGRVRIIAINDSWRLCPWAEVLYFSDREWWDEQSRLNRHSVTKSINFMGMVYSGFWVAGNTEFDIHPYVHSLRLAGQRGLSSDRRTLRHGSNSGYQAINLAYLYGASRIILLGYDMHVDPTRSHWHDETRPRNFQQLCDLSFLPHFQTLVEPLAAAGVEVINSTPGSALKCWPYLPVEEAIKLKRKEGATA